MGIGNIFRYIASYVCHQCADRGFMLAGAAMPLCARGMGIYSGFFIAFVFAWSATVRLKLLYFNRKVYMASGALLIALVVDGILSSSVDFYSLSNPARFLLGLFGGAALGIFSFALLNSQLKEKRYFAVAAFSIKHFLMLALILLVLASALFFPDARPVLYLWNFLSIAGLFFTYAAVNLTVVTVLLSGSKRKKRPVAVMAALTFILIAIQGLILFLLR